MAGKKSGSDRNAQPKEMVKVEGQVPAWLQEHAATDTSTEALDEYRVLSRLKIVQAMSDDKLKEDHGEGAVVVAPTNQLVCDVDGEFDIVPVFFFPEFIQWSDINDPGNSIMRRSFDPASEIARKARDPEQWDEGYGPEDGKGQHRLTSRYVEHLNFAGFITTEDAPEPAAVVLSFARGEFTKGRAFITAISMRRIGGKTVPLWAQRWRFVVGRRERDSRKWYGLDFAAPIEPFISQDEAAFYQEQHQEMKDLFEKQRLAVDRDEPANLDADLEM